MRLLQKWMSRLREGNMRLLHEWMEKWITDLLKRLCRSLLKKRLGDLLLGDLDLDQIDMQSIRDGRREFRLSDLALNAEFINRKLSGSAIRVKEGSIKLLVVKFPTLEEFKFFIQEKHKCFEIVVEGLVLKLVPSVVSEVPPVDTECSVSGSNSDTQASVKTNINESDSNHCSTPASLDVDEGVQKIAYAVKWFLTSLEITLENISIQFDPQINLDNKASEFNRPLVFTIRKTDFRTNIRDGIPKLHNFVTFKEAVIGFLKIDDVDAPFQNDLDRGMTMISSGHSTSAVLTGPDGGFSGELNLGIPWRDGRLDLDKIDADVTVHPLELRLQLSSIQWFMDVWYSLQRKVVDNQNCVHNTADMSMSTARSILCSSSSSSMKSGSDSVIAGGVLAQSTFSQSRQDEIQDSFTMAHVIPNWIPELVVHEDQGDPDSVCDGSIDQFFECFEELRNSQTNFGNSGIWDWTCSVFDAITSASTLASGSDQVPKEPPIEKSLHASVDEISIILLFSDEMDAVNSSLPLSPFNDMTNSGMFSSCLSSMHFEQPMISPTAASSFNMHHLEAKCKNIKLNLKTYPKNLSFKASIDHMKLDEYYNTENHDSDHAHLSTIFLNNKFCREVQDSLPQFPLAAQDYWVEGSGHSNELTKVELLKTFGKCTFHYDVSSTDQDGNSVSSTSLSICLAPLILWVHFHTVFMVLSFISELESDVLHGEHKFHRHGNEKNSKSTTRTKNSLGESLKIQITLSPARIIFCFPSESSWDLSHPSTLDKFLAIDHTSSLNLEETASPLRNERPNDVHPSTLSTSLHLSTGNFDIYLVRHVNNALDGRNCSLSRQAFFALKIFSVTGSNYHDSAIAMIWRKYPVSDPDMVNKALSLPQLHDRKIAQKENSKLAGISFFTTSHDLEESSSCICRELLQSTESLLHVQLSCVSVHLSKKDCGLLNQLLDHILNGLSIDGASSSSENGKEKSIPINDITIQTSVIFECSILDVCTELDDTVEVGPLLQTELEGSWNCLKLSISKFALFCFSNVGGVNNTSFLRVNHGEGELWGSITGKGNKTCEESKDFLLVVCKDSASRRGDGEGNNALSFGTAGCSVTHIRNPKLQENYTSVNVRSGTIVAPGGRMDWISVICLLSNSGSEQSDDSNRINNSQAGEPFLSSFFLELVDVAVSYEPHLKNPAHSTLAPEFKSFSCLLAASSFKLHNKSKSDPAAADFDVQLRDLGLLICGSFGSKNVTEGYGVNYLRQTGYTKIAHNTFIEAALRIDTSFWKLEISESQFDIGTCHDTTCGLIRLCSQLQQLYAPDMRDALGYLQSRWNSVQQANKRNMASDASDKPESSIDNLVDSGECKSDGLLDDIIDNVFFTDQDCTDYNCWNRNCHNSLSSSELVDEFELHTATNEAADVKVSCISLGSSLATPEDNTAHIPLRQNSCPGQIIDSYYMPELLDSSSSTLCNEDHQSTSGDDAGKTMNCEDGGWYNNIPLTIVENHVSKRNNPQGDHVFQLEGKPSICSLESDESCNLKGKVHVCDIDVKWLMYAGNDWSLAQKDATSRCPNGRDKSSSLEFIMSRLNIQFDIYPDGDFSVSKLSISAQDLNLCDQSTHAPWKMVVGCYNSKDYPRESCSSAFRLELESVRTEPQVPLEDYRLHLEILPLQLHLDEGQLNFLINFFLNGSCNNPHVPCENEIVDMEGTTYGSSTIVDEALLPFFQKFDVKPLVLHINYIPCRFDPIALGKGKYAELLNILSWKGIDLKLKHVSAIGIYGWNSICKTVAAEWLEDISKNQVHKLLKGLPLIKSLVAVSSGTKKLVSLPIKSYKKDRKLLKGMQRGAAAFVRSISIEAVGLGVHLAAGAHDIALKTERALTAIPPPLGSTEAIRTKDNIRANQPENAQQGIKLAYESLTEGLGRTASAWIGNPIKVYNRGAGAGPALVAAIYGVPAAAVTPMSTFTCAVHYTLSGIRNSLDPEHKKESKCKYLGPSQL